MSNTCTHCSRVNPADALYCFHDGHALSAAGAAGPINIGARPFPQPFVFPSGQACRSFDQLALACQQRWDEARTLLQQGHLERFLAALGRHDLAQAARAAVTFPDPDRGLDQFLARLPSQTLQPPRLTAEPLELNLGTLRPDTDHRFEVHLSNLGMRLLYGSVVSDSRWLALGDGPGASQKLFQFKDEEVLIVTVRAGQLRAGNKGLEGRLILESNGGNALVTVRAQVPSRPFLHGLLAGAATPRQLAEKAREAPRDAAPYFENGAVERWYRENGWTYPVQGPAANGLAAVQQFFEALGLAKPPRVELSEQSLTLVGRPGESLQHTLHARSPDKRPVFATVVSDAPWLRVGPVQSSGAAAAIPLHVHPVPAQPGQVLQARLTVTANGGQRFVVPVSLAIAAGAGLHAGETMRRTGTPQDTAVEPPRRKTAAKALVATGVPTGQEHTNHDEDDEENPSRGPLMLLAVLALFLLVGGGGVAAFFLLGGDDTPQNTKVAVADDPADKKAGPVVPEPKIEDEPDEILGPAGPVQPIIEDEPPERLPGSLPPAPAKVEIKDEPEQFGPKTPAAAIPVDPTPRVRYTYGNNGRFGLVDAMTGKRLTFSDNGSTNNTTLRVNGRDLELGSGGGKWVEHGKPLQVDKGSNAVQRTRSVYAIGGLTVTQILEIVPSSQPVTVNGQQRRLLDTLKVHYILENQEKKAWSIGLRIQVDTLIGGNDGVPFTVPGRPGLVDRPTDFTAPQQIPAFIQALEFANLQNPGTVVHMTLKPSAGHEPLSRLQLTHWPGSSYSLWNVSASPFNNDSCVVLYWNEKQLQPRARREFGFLYGLGRVDSTEPASKLGITLGGDFEPGQQFLITAYVQNPVPNQTLTLELPRGLERSEGPEVAPVPAPPKGAKDRTSIVTWKARVLEHGVFTLKVKSSTGVTQAKTITISRGEAQAEGKLTLDLRGSFEPGQVFDAVAKVTGPVPGQRLTLNLPRGLDRVGGEETQIVPPAVGAGNDATAEVRWKVRVAAEGRFPVRVTSSTGLVVTKTLTIARQDVRGGTFVLRLGGDMAPGKEFTIDAQVTDPLPGQTLTLRLPEKGLERVGPPAAQPVPAAPQGGASTVSWRVKVTEPGRYPIRVESTTGVVQRKTLTIADSEAGRFVVELSGVGGPGTEFQVIARVTDPAPGQRMTLKLPPKLQRVGGDETQAVPELGKGVRGTSTVTWRVRVLEAGVLPVRVESSLGVARTKRLTIADAGGNIFGK